MFLFQRFVQLELRNIRLSGGPLMPQKQGDKNLNVFSCSRGVTINSNYSFNTSKINEALQKYQKTDLLVTPEYSLYPGGQHRLPENMAEWPKVKLRLAPDGKKYELVSVDQKPNQNTKNLLQAVREIQAYARTHKTSIVLGTLPLYDEFEFDGKSGSRTIEVNTNAALIIDNEGNITASKIKTNGSDTMNFFNVSSNDPEYGKILEKLRTWSIDKSVQYEIKNKNGDPFSAYVFICADSENDRLLEHLRNKPVDLYVYSGVNGDDALAYEVSKKIQKGFELNQVDQWVARKLRQYNILEPNKSVLVYSHPGLRGLGAYYYFPSNPPAGGSYAIDNFTITSSDGIYAEFRVPKDPAPNPVPIPNQQPEIPIINRLFPNPSRGKFNISIVVPLEKGKEASFSNVSIGVYDINGKDVAKIMENSQLQDGSYSFRQDLSKLASGVYFVRVTVDDKTETQKLIISK